MIEIDRSIVDKQLPIETGMILYSDKDALWENTCDLKKENIGFVPIWVITETKQVLFIYDEDISNRMIKTLKPILFEPVENLIVDFHHLRFFQNVFFKGGR